MTLKRASPGPPGLDQPVRKKTLAKDPWGRPRFQGCESIKAYEMLGKLGEGTFGEVHKARHRANGKLVALKKILMHNAKEEGFPITALREIRILKMLGHTNIIQLLEMAVERKKERVVSPRGTMYMITPYMEHDLAGLLENKDVEFSDGLVKCYLLQLLEGTKYLHELQVLHRDMKAANLLIDNRGVLKIADFGLARIFDEPPPQAGHGGGRAQRDYTNCVVTRWYRPPELLLGEKRYTTAIDLWGIGCVFAEMYKRKPILQGNSDMDQMIRIFHLCGPPTQKSMPNWERLPNTDGIRNMHFQRKLESEHSRMGSSGVALLSLLLCLDPLKRINAIDALKHEYFRVDPKPLKPGEVPKFNDSHELDGKKNRNAQHRGPPPAPVGGAVGGQGGGEWGAPRAGEPWTANGGGSRRPPGGDNWGNGSGPPPPGRRPYDRAPAHDVRVPPSHRDGPAGHRPPWAQKASDAPIRDAGLPPRPPGPMDRDRSKPPRPRLSGGPDVDTYIPSYNSSDRGPPDGDRRVEDRRPRIPDEGRRRVTGGPDDDRRLRIPDDDRRPRGPPPLDDRRAQRDWERGRDRGGSRERFPRDRGYSAGRSTSRDPHPTEPPRDTYRR